MAAAVLFPKAGVAPAPDVRVLPATDYAILLETQNLLEQARSEAAALIERAKLEAEDIRRQGLEEGRAEGKAEIAMQMLETVTASVEQLAGVESSLIDVVMRSLRTILGKFDQEDLVAQVVGHALRLVRDEKRILLRVATSDADAVQARLADIVRQYSGMGRVDVVSDAAISPGGCVLETESGVIDAALDRQLAMIEAAFRKRVEGRKA
ncbi:MAG: HrpE/YscL family type III secretion apparatus protein [Planctomycetota bacterium]|nr:HrpE/YscL family type III secretion apparatus protein [Planctomycetota bacterium]